MTHDNPNLTAYALNELSAGEREQIGEMLKSDSAAARIVEQTEFLAGVLGAHFSRPRRRLRLIPMALAASILIVATMVSILCRSPEGSRPAIATKAQFVGAAPISSRPAQSVLLENMPATEVEQFVASVLADASRVGTFSSLRLTSDPLASDLPVSFR